MIKLIKGRLGVGGGVITKVNQFDSSLRCQQDVVAFDVTMDYPVVVQMLETLQVGRRDGGVWWWGG